MNDLFTPAPSQSAASVPVVVRSLPVQVTWQDGRIAAVASETADDMRRRAVSAVNVGLRNGRSLEEQALAILAMQELVAGLIALEAGRAETHAHSDSESALLRDVLVYVTGLPDGMFWRNNTGRLPTASGQWVSFGCIGSGDVLGVLRGRAVAIETKSSTGEQRQSQIRFQARWEAAGGLYVLARSVEDVRAGLERVA